jgi:glycogen debranching enzyme
MNIQINVERVPFSRAGSYLMINRLTKSRAQELGKAPGLFLRTAQGGVAMPDREIFRIEATHAGRRSSSSESASPGCLQIAAGGRCIDVCFENERTLRFRGRGSGVRLTAKTSSYDYAMPAGERWMINHFTSRTMFMLTRLAGELRVDAPWHGERAAGIGIEASGAEWEFALEEFQCAWEQPASHKTFDDCVAASANEFESWRGGMAPLPAYILWESTVAPRGHFSRPAILMSKNWMVNVWSWDHCFNAIALARPHPDLAWDQLMLVFDHQHPSGALPDTINDAGFVWNFTKPPIHGWALRWMMRHSNAVTQARMREVYKPLCRWTKWWFAHRDDDRDGVPQYNHGNDSGWDNATAFALGMPVEGPDLAAYLVVQMDVLSDLARKLGKKSEASRWAARAKALAAALLAHSWRDDRFVAPRSGNHEVFPSADCLLHCLPIVAADYLPEAVCRKLVRNITRFVTPHGLATEHPDSPYYVPDGYWRGPVWAPEVMLIVDGLRSCGARRLADTITKRFRRTCQTAGFAENFNALTGEGLRDQAYTWTASVYLALTSLQHSATPTR